jgi:hypothetical protein
MVAEVARAMGLIEEQGANMVLPDLALRLARGCPKANALNLAERCLVHLPQLVELD